MLRLITTVREQQTHIYEMCAQQLLSHIIDRLGRAHTFANVDLQSETRTTSKSVDEDNNAKINRDRCIATLRQNYNLQSNKWDGNGVTVDLGNGNTLVTGGHNTKTKKPWKWSADTLYTVFANEEVQTLLEEQTVGSNFTLEVQMIFTSSTTAAETLQRLYQTFTNGEMIEYFDLVYDYPVPNQILNTLYVINQLAGYDKQQFFQWLYKNSDSQITLTTNRRVEQNSRECVIKRNQKNAMFQIECSQEDIDAAQTGKFVVSFNVTCQFSKTDRLLLEYPETVKNRLMPFDYVPVDPEQRLRNEGNIRWQNVAVDGWYKQQEAEIGKPLCVRYPWWDDWPLSYTSILAKRNYEPFFIGIITLDNIDDPTATTDINITTDIPGYALIDEVKQAYKELGARALETGEQFHIGVFADDMQVDPSMLEFDGEVLKIKNRTITRVYRVMLSQGPAPKAARFTQFRVLSCRLLVETRG